MHVMKHLSPKRAIGAVLVAVGIILVVVGNRTETTGFEKVKKHVMHDNSYSASSKYIVSGVALVVVGAAMVVFCRKKKH